MLRDHELLDTEIMSALIVELLFMNLALWAGSGLLP